MKTASLPVRLSAAAASTLVTIALGQFVALLAEPAAATPPHSHATSLGLASTGRS